MFIFKRDDDDICLNGNAGCTPSFTIMGPNPSEKDDTTSSGPPQYDQPGPHRFIGIGTVAGMAFLVLVAYLIFGRWPRRMRRKYCRCLGGRRDDEAPVDEGKASIKQVAVILESASMSSAEEVTHRHSRQMSDYRTDINQRSKSRKQSSSRHRRRSSARISNEGAVTEGKSVDVESGVLVTGWEVEHVRGVRYEVHTPTDHETEQRSEVHIQKPCLAYISGNNR